MLPQIHIKYSSSFAALTALMDSGDAGNFIDHHMAKLLQSLLLPLSKPLCIHDIDCGAGPIIHYTPTFVLHVIIQHKEIMSFLIMSTHAHPIILGMPWMEHHNPVISWTKQGILQWSPHCLEHCLQHLQLCLASTTVESPETADQVQFPKGYHTLMEVFSKKKASGLPPHRAHECTIYLLLGTFPPGSPISPLCVSEQQAMEEYVQEAITQGYI